MEKVEAVVESPGLESQPHTDEEDHPLVQGTTDLDMGTDVEVDNLAEEGIPQVIVADGKTRLVVEHTAVGDTEVGQSRVVQAGA